MRLCAVCALSTVICNNFREFLNTDDRVQFLLKIIKLLTKIRSFKHSINFAEREDQGAVVVLPQRHKSDITIFCTVMGQILVVLPDNISVRQPKTCRPPIML